MALALIHQTKAQLRNRLRRRYRAALGADVGRVANRILALIEDGTFTDAQIKAEFGKDDAQYVIFKARLIRQRDEWLAVQSAAGD